MASGTISGTTNNQYITSKLEWSSTPNVSTNQSDLVVSLYVYKSQPQAYHTWGPGSWTITAGGTSGNFTPSVDLYADQGWVLIGTLSTTITHSADGSAAVTISASGGMPSTSYTETYCSATVALDNIPRASTLTFPSTMTMGVEYDLEISAASEGFSHDIVLTWGGVYYLIARMVSGTQQWTFSEDLATVIPNSTSGSGTLTLHTYSSFASNPDDRTLIGSRHYPVTLLVPESFIPSIIDVSISEAVDGLADKFGVYVQSKSMLSVKISAIGDHGSAIQSYSTSIQGRSYSGASFTSDILTASGTISITVKVVDSRGRSRERKFSVSVTSYSPPQITALNAWRIDTAGNEADSGERLALQLAYAVSSIGGKNDRTLTIQYRQGTTGSLNTISSGTAEVSYSGTTNYTDSPALSSDYTYTVLVTLADYFTSISYSIQIPTAQYILDVLGTKDGMAAGKAAETPGLFDVAWNLRTRQNMVVDGDESVGGNLSAGKSVSSGTGIELGRSASGHGGYLDFHFNASTEDYTSRIIESASGVLQINAGKSVSLGTISNPTDVLKTLLNPTNFGYITDFNTGKAALPGLWRVYNADGSAAHAPYSGAVSGVCLVVVVYTSDGTMDKAHQLFLDGLGDVYYKVYTFGVSYGTWKKLTS